VTLIATALSDRCVAQAVDRRLTYTDGRMCDDLANKALCGVCADARFSMCYTGLVMMPIPTDEWIANFLTNERLLSKPLRIVLDALADKLTVEFTRFRRIPNARKGLTIATAGFGPLGPFASTITNQEDAGGVLTEPSDEFHVFWLLRNERRMKRLDMIFHGAELAIDESLTQAIAKIRRALFLKDGNRISSALVAIIRRAANHPKYGAFISPHCISMVQNRECPQIICHICHDHFLGERSKAHLPHFLSPTMTVKDICIRRG